MDGDLAGMVAVARAHREHERYHSLLKLEHAVDLRRDANTLKVLADRWLDGAPGEDGPGGPAAGCPDLYDRAAVATTGVLFLQENSEPDELVAMKRRLEATADEFGRVSDWLAGHMAAAWRGMDVLLTPELAGAARPRFAALARTTEAGLGYGVAARLIGAAVGALRRLDLTPAGVRADPAGAAALVRAASWLLDLAAGGVAGRAAALGLSDPDWTEFLDAVDAV